MLAYKLLGFHKPNLFNATYFLALNSDKVITIQDNTNLVSDMMLIMVRRLCLCGRIHTGFTKSPVQGVFLFLK